MFRKILLYGLPVYLYVIELLIKSIARVNSDSLAGPTLAGAGIGFLLPLTELKQLNIDASLSQALKDLKARAYSPRDKKFCDLVWLTFFASLGGWMYSISLTLQYIRHPQSATVNWALVIGCLTFAVSILLAEVKERI
jgi:uncharacterized membrane protein (DUF485 family)